MAEADLSLRPHNGRMLTEEEINLLELYAKRAEITLARNEQTRKQQRILAQVTSIVQEVKSRPNVAAKASQDAASQDSQEAPASKKPKLEVQPTSEVEAPAAIMKTTAAIPFDFTPAFLLLSESWSTLTEHANKGGPKEFQLDNFAFDKKQTLAFKLTVPANSPRWSVNIGFPSDLGWQNILLHFNPRKEKKKRRYQLLHNDRTANHWGLIESMLIDEDLLFGRTFELVLQVLPDGFFIAVDGAFCSFFAHRSDMHDKPSLLLQLPIANDYGDPENAVFDKIWWGYRDTMPCFLDRKVVDRLSKTMQDTDRSRTCFVSGLAKTEDENAIIEISDLLFTLFEPYKTVDVQILPGKGQAYITLESPAATKEAIAALHGFVIEEEGGTTYQLSVGHSRAGL